MNRILFFLTLFMPFFGFAQSNFKAGYVITNAGDSVPGFVNYKEREQNASTFIFKSAENGPTRTYGIGDCLAYGMNDIVSYQRFAVAVSLSPESINRLSIGRDSSSRRDTVFLKVIQAGKIVTLYSYSDPIKTRFYIKERDSSEPVELIYANYLISENGKTETYNKYIRQLNALLVKNNILTQSSQGKLGALSYTQGSILAVVSVINSQKSEKGIKATRFFVGAGVNSSTAKYTGSSVFNRPGVRRKGSYEPMITAGIDLFANPHVGRLIYRAELSYASSKNEFYATDPDPTVEYKIHSFDSYTFSLTPQVLYNLYNSKPFKMFLGVGGAITYSKNTKNTIATKVRALPTIRIDESDLKFNPFFIMPQVSAGIVLKQKVELFGNYTITDYQNFGIRMVRYNLGLKYLFGG
jgi:hypothetical protein